ncbi:MAG TPA: COX15/CtaA family protein [Chitinophagaceae bacterium]|nr:COX15/CtaA family protein [Chitinophagaceae bacterium]
MHELVARKSTRPIAIWLLVGLAMMIIQVLLGGITRLTGSGLSITEWKPILGVLPPLNEEEWSKAFEKYRQIAQYKYLNPHFSLEDFKFIFFWEWLHRLWARLIALAFLVPFAVFLAQKRFNRRMIRPMILLFLLGLLQGLVGWIMVQSGLGDSERVYVSHYRLAIHFILALGLIVYTLWFALQLLIPDREVFLHRGMNRFTRVILYVTLAQLIYGAFMAGLKAAPAAPTWPDINGSWLPHAFTSFGDRRFTGLSFLFDNPVVVHFIHRNLAYLIFVLAAVWWIKAARVNGSETFRRSRHLFPMLVFTQVLLGILTVLSAARQSVFLWVAVAHQFVAMLLILSLAWLLFLVRRN